MCVFHRPTISLLRSLSIKYENHNNGNLTLGQKMWEATKKDALFPLLNFQSYRKLVGHNRSSCIRFDPPSYYLGLDKRVDKLLSHVDQCIHTHGEQVVLAL